LKKLELGQIIGILANVGVIAGIIFLALQIRQGNELMQSEASIAYVEMRRDGLRNRGQDREHLRSIIKSWNGEELSQLESLSLDFYHWSTFVNWEWEYGQYVDGILEVLDQPPELRWRAVIDYYPGMRTSWEAHKDSLSPEFVQWMEENVVN